MELKKVLIIFGVLAAAAAVAIAGGFVGDKTCSGCHGEAAAALDDSLHSGYFKENNENRCETCHGAGSEHAGSADPAKIAGYDENDEEGNDIFDKNCTTCHITVLHGVKGEHVESRGLNCGSCHRIHQPAGLGTLVKDEKRLCEGCHTGVRAKSMLPSHHPISEGKMECTSCHDMRGGTGIDMDRPNDICLDCHAQYRGPFVYEHSPVAESCSICHSPHGSVANNLLKQNEPFLCLQCHQMHFHTQKPGEDGTFTPPNHPDRSVISDTTATKRGMLTRCTNCHQSVHGSDLPSQEISNQGRALTR